MPPLEQKTTNNYTLTANDPKQRGLEESFVVYSLGVNCPGPPTLDLEIHSLALWGSTLSGSTLWGSTLWGQLWVNCLGPPILDLVVHSHVLKKLPERDPN